MSRSMLTNVEFLCLKMQAHPGRSGRFYRWSLTRYTDPQGMFHAVEKANDLSLSDFHRRYYRDVSMGGRYGLYFRRTSREVGRYWVDSAPRTVRDKMSWRSQRLKPTRSEWHLTRRGWEIANRARRKLSLEEIPWESK